MKPSLLAIALLGAATLPLSAEIITKPVAYEHGGVKLEGYLAYDDAVATKQQKAPGVLVLPEWWGLTEYPKSRAEQLARLGYVAFVADMYGAGVTTTDAKKAGELARPFYGKPLMHERARAGLEQLLATGLVNSGHVAAIGYCFGGSAALALAYTGAPLAGVVGFHASFFPVPEDAAAKTKAKLLICHGAVDPFIEASELATFMTSMNSGKFDYQFVSYAGAIHAFTNPGADKLAAANNLGGKVGYNAAADQRSWEHMKLFFKEVLGK
jgi:dienelactone hydrolase